jgi:ABC-type transporter Mla subunit MlaD
LTFKVRFPAIHGLKVEDPVVYERNQIGKVVAITYTKEGSYMVEVAIAREFVHATTSNSRFLIGQAPDDETGKAIEVVNSVKGGEPLAQGATVEGSSRTAVLLDQVLDGMKDTLKDLEGSLEEMTKPLRKIPESDEVKKLQEKMNDLMEALKQQGTHAREKFEKDILPELEKKMDELRERFKKFGREKELDPLEKELKDLKRI